MPVLTTHDRTAPGAFDSLEEFRVLARAAEAHRRRLEPDPGPRLPNGTRMARLHAIADNPYLRAAFGHMTTLEMMRMCAEQLAAAAQFKSAGQLLDRIAHHENRRAAIAPPTPTPEPPAPSPVLEAGPADRQFELAIPRPAGPRPTAWQVFVEGLTDRELAVLVRFAGHATAVPPRRPPVPCQGRRASHDQPDA